MNTAVTLETSQCLKNKLVATKPAFSNEEYHPCRRHSWGPLRNYQTSKHLFAGGYMRSILALNTVATLFLGYLFSVLNRNQSWKKIHQCWKFTCNISGQVNSTCVFLDFWLIYLKTSLQFINQSVKTRFILTMEQYLLQIFMKSPPHASKDPTSFPWA